MKTTIAPGRLIAIMLLTLIAGIPAGYLIARRSYPTAIALGVGMLGTGAVMHRKNN